jgi:hypothetical protein
MAFGFRFGGSQAAVEKLASGKLKEEEKQQLLQTLPQTNPVELIALLSLDDQAIATRAAAAFVPRADAEAVSALVADLLERTTGGSNGLKVLQKCREDLLVRHFDAALAQPKPEVGRKLWEFALELAPAVNERYLERAVREAPGAPRLLALRRLLKARGAEALRALLLESASNRELAVRKEALTALAPLPGEDVFSVMLERLGADDAKEVRDFASRYLQQYINSAPPEVRPRVLGRLLLAGEPEQRSQLVKSMFGQAKSDELLLGVLQFCKTLTGQQHRTVMESLQTVGKSLVPHAVQL